MLKVMIMSKVEVKKSKIGGMGVFAVKKMKKNEKAFRFSNNLIYINHRPGCHCKICKRCINLKKNYWLYPNDCIFGWNLNHSCNPNCYSKGRDIFSLRNIRPGEEITIDYSTTTVDKKWKMKCSCGKKNCRKIIRSVQFLTPRLFRKYKGFMPIYVEVNYRK